MVPSRPAGLRQRLTAAAFRPAALCLSRKWRAQVLVARSAERLRLPGIGNALSRRTDCAVPTFSTCPMGQRLPL
ncbi:MAG: hypothetical protein LUC35_07915 [Clostridiales bacterium]|nr:hypothetical protein [Clostridiales bacterium]